MFDIAQLKMLVARFDKLSPANQIAIAFPVMFVVSILFSTIIDHRDRINHPNRAQEQAASDAAAHKAWEDDFNKQFAERLTKDKDGYWTLKPCAGCAREGETGADHFHRLAQEKRDRRELGLE